MMKSKTPRLGPLKNGWIRRSARELRIVKDWLGGKREELPITWSRSNVVILPTSKWLRAFRRRLKLSLHKFGGLAGVQAEDVRSWEKGKIRPNESASRLLGLLAQKPHLVKFMQREWPDDYITKAMRK